MNNFQNPYAQYPLYQNPQYPTKNGIIWVQGIEGAKAYQLSPNSNVMLLDSETDGRFYIKTSDNIGMCNLRIFDYKEVTEQSSSSIDMSQYVTRKELNELISSIKKGNENEQSVQSTKQKSKSFITE